MNPGLRELISPSSPFHLAWFVCSVVMLGISIVAAVMRFRAPAKYFCFFHVAVAIEVPFVLLFGYDGPVFSVHCIWFNALMAFIHWQILTRTRA